MKARALAGVMACVFVLGACDQVREYIDPDTPEPPAAEAVAPYS